MSKDQTKWENSRNNVSSIQFLQNYEASDVEIISKPTELFKEIREKVTQLAFSAQTYHNANVLIGNWFIQNKNREIN